MFQSNYSDLSGILLLDKPLGISSHHALQKVKRSLGAKKAGHTGSLDPLATGMLPLCFGEATKFSRFFLEGDKCYQFTMRLGVTTTTGDSEGEIIGAKQVNEILPEKIMQMICHFQGTQHQIPPMFSALKYQGQPLYKLARRGKEVERAPRRVTIYRLVWEHSNPEEKTLTFTAECSKGTYIRTLVENMGDYLGCGAHVSALRRLWAAPFLSHTMVTLENLQNLANSQHINVLYPIYRILSILFPSVPLSSEQATCLLKGQVIYTTCKHPPGWVCLMHEDTFLGMGEFCIDGQLIPRRLMQLA